MQIIKNLIKLSYFEDTAPIDNREKLRYTFYIKLLKTIKGKIKKI